MKRCFKCEETKPLSEFYAHPKMKDGHLGKCSDCTRIDVKSHRRLNESVQKYDRTRAKLPHRKANIQRVSDAWAVRNPQAHKAQTALHNAVRDGKIKREPCIFCGTEERIHGHHCDYSKPLEVTWLCAKCHHRYHALVKMEKA